MKSLPMLYEQSISVGIGVAGSTVGFGAGAIVQQNVLGLACKPPSVSAQDFPFLCIAIALFGVAALSFFLGGRIGESATFLMWGFALASLGLYIKIPKYSKKALARYEEWSRLSICESCGVVGNEKKETFHYSNIQPYLRKL